MSPLPNPTNTLSAEQESLLDEHLDSLRAATESIAVPAHLEARLISAFKAHHARRSRREMIAQWFAPGVAMAACVGMLAWVVLVPMVRSALDPGTDSTAATMARIYADSPFIALQSLEQIALEPRPRLIETAVPRMWLASYGVPVNPESAGDPVRAEMLVSASGQPLAMRFVP